MRHYFNQWFLCQRQYSYKQGFLLIQIQVPDRLKSWSLHIELLSTYHIEKEITEVWLLQKYEYIDNSYLQTARRSPERL